eukprot:GGOE01056356.1.p1 GENE.GGOE01056356.1~~GGOE01056356.1.p1  ORF type:complete len:994 (+),score=310.99 GGOE01056356.1:265-2982(+)
MARARNTTSQAQGMVAALVVSFGNFMGTVITDLKAVGTDYASRLRTESASRTQAIFYNLLQGRILALQRQAKMYELSMLNLSRYADQPMDDGHCALLASLCTTSAEIKNNLFIGTMNGVVTECDMANNVVHSLLIERGSAADTYSWIAWPRYTGNFPAWKQSCVASPNYSTPIGVCPHGTAVEWPNRCNGTCGYDPRCRSWFMKDTSSTPRTRMTAVYLNVYLFVPVVTLTYPIYSSTLGQQVGIACTNFYFSDLDAYLSTLSSGSVSQLVTVIFNSTDLLVVGSNRACANKTEWGSGVSITQVCHPQLRELGSWLVGHQNMTGNASLKLGNTLWDVFPGTVDSFSYFVAVGMNETEVYAVINAASQQANDTLHSMSQQQATHMADLEVAALAEMDAMSAQKIAEIQGLQKELQLHMMEMQNETAQAFNSSRRRSTQDLSQLISNEMGAIELLESYHLSRVKSSIGTTFGAVVGIFVGILLFGAYGTWAVMKQVEHIAQVMEDVAQMRVEKVEISGMSSVREVQRIGVALGVLVARLAEYKSYMPAGLFLQAGNDEPMPEACPSPTAANRQQSLPSRHASITPIRRGSSTVSRSTGSNRRTTNAHAVPVASNTRLLRRSVVAMAVNMVHFQGEMAQRSPVQVEGMLNRVISAVHGVASKSQGNIDAIVGDQVLVTFNAHFACSDPPTAAANVALDLMEMLKTDTSVPVHIQIGLAAGMVYTGHLGYAGFKAMVALGPPMKVASLLSHLSGFRESVVLVCPSVEERIKYSFILQPADLVALPTLGDYVTLFSKSVNIFALEAKSSIDRESDEWLYQVSAGEKPGHWAAMFSELVKAQTTEKVKVDLEAYVMQHPEARLARRLLGRLAHWQPGTGIVLAERPDVPRDAATCDTAGSLPLSLSLCSLK